MDFPGTGKGQVIMESLTLPQLSFHWLHWCGRRGGRGDRGSKQSIPVLVRGEGLDKDIPFYLLLLQKPWEGTKKEWKGMLGTRIFTYTRAHTHMTCSRESIKARIIYA
jgi:hypothetical protein